MTVVDDLTDIRGLVRREPSQSERERLLGEWATGVEPCDVLALVTVIRHLHAIPGARIAAHCADEVVTYGDLPIVCRESASCSVDEPTTDPTTAGLLGLLSRFVEAARAGHGEFGRRGLRLSSDALAVAVADRRCVAADRRPCRFDPARRPADVRLLALPWGDPQHVVDLIAAWSSGASVIVPTEEQRRDPAVLVELIRRHGVTQVVADSDLPVRILDMGAGELTSIARWDLCGTRYDSTLPAALRRLSPEAVATVAFRAPAYVGAVARGPITTVGWTRPVPGAKILVLDAELCPVSPGVVGDIHVGGRALATGFADGRDEDRFLDDPFEPGARLFRTEQRAWWTAEGRLIVEP